MTIPSQALFSQGKPSPRPHIYKTVYFEGSRNLFLDGLLGAIVAKKIHFLVKRDNGLPAEGVVSSRSKRGTIVVRAAQSRARGGKCALIKIDERNSFEALVVSEGRLGNEN